MSDYLWDKSGEPDPAIERLENLLAAKRYEHEPLRLPPPILLSSSRPVRTRAVYTQIAALAAVMVLAVAIGVWVRESSENSGTKNASIAADDISRNETGEEAGRLSASNMTATSDVIEPEPNVQAFSLIDKRERRRAKGIPGAAGRRRRSVQMATDEPLGVARLRRRSQSRLADYGRSNLGLANANERRADVRFHAEQRYAKEQLMLAMRMTSAKLNIARSKTHTRARRTTG